MKKKSQMEVMGLVIVVILLSIGMLFAIRFVIMKKPTDYKSEFTQTEMASNMLSTLMKTTAPVDPTTISEYKCHGLSFKELFQDCGDHHEDPGQLITCDDLAKNSCDYIETYTNDVLTKTLVKWNIGYEFTATVKTAATDPEEIISSMPWESTGGCPGVKKHKSYPIPIDAAGTKVLTLSLDICDKVG